MTQFQKTILSVILILLLIGLGFYVGRNSVKITTQIETKYLPGDTIRDSIPKPYPVYISTPQNIDTVSLLKHCIASGLYDEYLPTKVKDSLIYMEVDTTAILKDWLAVRKYENQLFSIDTLGSCTVFTELQYNRIQNMKYTFAPVQKVTTEVKEKKFTVDPFIGAGLSMSGHGLIQLGTFTSNGFGFGYQYQHGFNDKRDTHSLMILYKFK